ncbi:MAG: hypothetical protein M1132_10855 [Chloroflexi bacterium]|nr:hypothetical protein [Chloroflexota bacterium]
MPEQNPETESEIILGLISAGILEYERWRSGGKGADLIYPTNLNRGLARLCLFALRNSPSARYPESVPDLLSWCERPLIDLPLQLPTGLLGQYDCLISNNQPTEQCGEWARTGGDPESDLLERKFMKAALDACRQADAQATYVAFRKWLIENPVASEENLVRVTQDPRMEPVRDLIHDAYFPAPATHAADGHFALCASCRNLLLKGSKGDEWICENPRCAERHRIRIGQRLPQRMGIAWLRWELRRFVAIPGLSELRLARQLKRSRLTVELWPEFDAYDLRVIFPNQRVWAIDVKDWEYPWMAQYEDVFPMHPQWDSAFFVFPRERRKRRIDYKREFGRNYRHGDPHLDYVYDDELMKRARAVAASGGGAFDA